MRTLITPYTRIEYEETEGVIDINKLLNCEYELRRLDVLLGLPGLKATPKEILKFISYENKKQNIVCRKDIEENTGFHMSTIGTELRGIKKQNLGFNVTVWEIVAVLDLYRHFGKRGNFTLPTSLDWFSPFLRHGIENARGYVKKIRAPRTGGTTRYWISLATDKDDVPYCKPLELHLPTPAEAL